MEKNKVLYSLYESDFQDTAQESIGRELTQNELERSVKVFGNAIPWHEYITLAIQEVAVG